MPMMNPSPSEIVELFTFVEVTLIQYATVAGHFPGVAAASAKTNPKKVNTRHGWRKRKVQQEERNSNAFPSSGEYVRRAIKASMSTRLTTRESQLQ